jgi:hypothetical protein
MIDRARLLENTLLTDSNIIAKNNENIPVLLDAAKIRVIERNASKNVEIFSDFFRNIRGISSDKRSIPRPLPPSSREKTCEKIRHLSTLQFSKMGKKKDIKNNKATIVMSA